MTTTASQLITAALGLTLTRAADIPLEPDEQTDTIFQLNNMMASWNLPLGFTVVSNANDTITTPDYSIDAMIQNLAVRIAPQFGGLVDADLRQNAAMAKKDLLIIAVTVGEVGFPQTLPQGAGNTRFGNNTFYPPSSAEIEQETGGSIELET